MSRLVEKLLADDLAAVDRLIGASETSGGAHVRIRRALQPGGGRRGALLTGCVHLLGIRYSPHNPRTRSSVIDDLLIHDIDLALDLLGGSVTSVSGGHCVSPDGVEELADSHDGVRPRSGMTLSSSRASQRKVRSLSLSSADLLVEIDLLRHDLTTYHHRSGEVVDRDGPIYRARDGGGDPVRPSHRRAARSSSSTISSTWSTSDASRDAERASLRAHPHGGGLIKAGVR